MCDVDRKNLPLLFPKIESAIRNSDFLAVDTEFTSLVGSLADKPSLFDDMEIRYRKSRNSVTKAAICQLGLSAFKKDPNNCSLYEVKIFNFYLCPQALGLIDPYFTCQASSLQFLVRFKFDFNKFIYDGISYMNEIDAKKLEDHLAKNKMVAGLERSLDEDSLQEICSSVATWLISAADGDEMEISKPELNEIPPFIVKQELLLRFPDLHIENRAAVVHIYKISEEQKVQRETRVKQDQGKDTEEAINRMLGFTRVFRVMKECQKPLVGHNMFLDLLLMYDKFCKPLPAKYSEFKREIHAIFPVIYDTKHITGSIRRPLESTGLFRKTFLENLYKDLHSFRGQEIVLHQPVIQHNTEHDKYEENELEEPKIGISGCNLSHEAGWDSYMCGYVFLRMAHIVTFLDIKSADVTPCTFHRYLSTMSRYKNRVNLIRGHLSHICLDGLDPKSKRADLLYLTSRKMWQTIDIEQVAKLMSRYGSVDVQPLGRSRALIAASTISSAQDILKGLRNDKVYYVTRYRMWKHSRLAQGLLWSGLLLSGGVCAWVLLSNHKKE